MPTAPGRLEDGRVVVDDEAHVNRLWDKGAYGERERGPRQLLEPIEAAYLVEQGRLRVEHPDDGSSMSVRDLLAYQAGRSEGFETAYLVYRELRSRGLVVRRREDGGFDLYKEGAHPRRQKPATLVAPRAASAGTTPGELSDVLAQARSLGRAAILSIVDEESDVTHYELSRATLDGTVRDPAPELAADARALVLGDRAVLVDDPGLQEGGYGKRTGDEVYLSLPEAHHLAEHGMELETPEGDRAVPEDVRDRVGRLSRYGSLAVDAYAWLRDRGLIPKTGFKYGVNFRVYETPIGDKHAPYLVQVAPDDDPWTFQELARLARLAHGVKKRPIVWSPGDALTLAWTRP